MLSRPGAGFACSRQRLRFGFSRTHRGRHGLGRSPDCRDDRRPANSFKEFYTGDRLGRDHRPDRVRLCLALALRRTRRRSRLRTASPIGRAGVQQQQLAMHPLLSAMTLGPAGPLDHLPGVLTSAAISTATAGLAHRRDPCSCRLAGPHGTDPARP